MIGFVIFSAALAGSYYGLAKLADKTLAQAQNERSQNFWTHAQ